MCFRTINLGTRLNDRHSFKQPLPHLRDRMTVMCVLSKISGLRDKIRVTELHDVIVRSEGRRSRSTAGAKKRVEKPAVPSDRSNDSYLKFDQVYSAAKRGSQGETDLTIRVGLAKMVTGEMQISEVREKGEGSEINRIITRSRHRSNGTNELQANAGRCVSFNFHHKNHQGLVFVVPAPKRDPNRVTVREGVGPAPQHWESMISKYPRNEIDMTWNDDAGDGESVLNSKSSQFPSKEGLARGLCNSTMVTNEDSCHYDGRYVDEDKNHSLGLRSDTDESKHVASTLGSAGKKSGFKRIALEFFDIFGAVRKNTNHVRSRTTTRTKTLYERLPPDSSRNTNDRRRVKIIYRSA